MYILPKFQPNGGARGNVKITQMQFVSVALSQIGDLILQ